MTKCSCCTKEREVNVVNSPLFPLTRIYLCDDCMDAGHEPRWGIIIHARAEGEEGKISPEARPYISKHLYCGDTITAEEIIA